jgi:hypothetical protein
VLKQEDIRLDKLRTNITSFVIACARGGEKENLGDYGKGTVRNALSRFEVFIAQQNQPSTEVTTQPLSKRSHLFGLMANDIWIADDFDAPLDEF